jgi:hypothetical protein
VKQRPNQGTPCTHTYTLITNTAIFTAHQLAARCKQGANQSTVTKMGVRVITAALMCYVLAAVMSPQQASAADATCSKGDTPCWCNSIGGTWRALQAPLLPACKVTYQHQGMSTCASAYVGQHSKHTVSPCQLSPGGVHIALLACRFAGARHSLRLFACSSPQQ